jgi:hypothetical protein
MTKFTQLSFVVLCTVWIAHFYELKKNKLQPKIVPSVNSLDSYHERALKEAKPPHS